MKNAELARIFGRIADALEIRGDTGFRVLAYRRAGRAIADLAADISELDAAGTLEQVAGVGKAIAAKVHEYLTTGRMAKYDAVRRGLPAGLFDMLAIQGVGPKTVKAVYERLGITDPAGLRRAAEDGRLAALPGFGEKRAVAVLAGIRTGETAAGRMYLNEAFELAEAVAGHMQKCPHARRVAWAGSLRRGCETVGDIDMLVTGPRAAAIVQHFLALPGIVQVIGAGRTKASVQVRRDDAVRRVDLRVLPASEYGSALQYFTGSKDHNIALRALTRKQGLKVSEYGVFRGKKRIAGRAEEGVYRAVGLPFIEPELRENRGELDAAREGRLPHLVKLEDVKGDLHIHTSLSDGAASLEEMVAACCKRGYRYAAIADHSASAQYAGGLSPDALERHCDRVEALNRRTRGFTVLKASEVDIRLNGRLDYSDRLLARLDFVTASVHQGFNHNVTERMCDALSHPLVHAISHPTGRIIGRREGYQVDLEQVIACAARCAKVLELNAYYGRLDLSDIWARRAAEFGVLIAVNTDAHAVADLDWMRYGILTARRAWLAKESIVNCRPLSSLLGLLRGVRSGPKG